MHETHTKKHPTAGAGAATIQPRLTRPSKGTLARAHQRCRLLPPQSGVARGWRCLKGLVAMATIGFRGRHLVPASANRRWEPELQPRVTLLPCSHTVAKSRDPLPGVAQSARTDSQAQHGGARAGGAGAGTRSQAGEVSWVGARIDGQTGRQVDVLPAAHCSCG